MYTEKTSNRILSVVALTIVLFFFLTIGVRTFTRQVLVKHFGITNAFTNVVLFDRKGLSEASAGGTINWAELYPFYHQAAETTPQITIQHFSGLKKKIDTIKSNVETYVTDFLIGYDLMTQWERVYRNVIHWNFVPYSEYNGIIKMSDGYLTNIVPSGDVSEQVASAVELSSFCAEQGADFLYIQAPHKICKVTDTTLSGSTDFSNQNADSLLAGLSGAGLETLDLREVLHQEQLSHHELFYRTDHHWKAETGLWASKHILQELNSRYGFHSSPDLLNDDRFKKVVYPSWFLGSQGKKVTLAQTTPEDISLLYPDYPTQLHFLLPSKNLDIEGDFSILYNMDAIEECDYMSKNPYSAYAYGDQPLEQITNPSSNENRKILLIHDSFSDCVIPFLALGLRNVDAIDLRHFTGSLQCYIASSCPDIVVVMYNCGATGKAIDRT